VISIDETTGLARRRKERKIELEKAEAEMHENFSKLVSDISRDMEKETTDKLNKMVDQAVADWDKIVDDFKMESDEIVINFKEAMKKKNKDFDPTFYDLDSIVKED
jgi:vacuolar-type H+-ATPase subunit H